MKGIVLERGSRVSLRRQLVGHLEWRILAGTIAPGRRLPSVRRAEELLGLHRNTVAAAYGELARAGLVQVRPGSGAFVCRPSRHPAGSVARVMVRGPGELDLACEDSALQAVLEAELKVRLRARVSAATGSEPGGLELRLAPSTSFVRWVRCLPSPSTVAVVSASEVVHRLASVATLIHGRERIGYLPVSPASRPDLTRMARLTRTGVADHSAYLQMPRWPPVAVVPLCVIAPHSYAELLRLLRVAGRRRGGRSTCRKEQERSLHQGVTQP